MGEEGRGGERMMGWDGREGTRGRKAWGPERRRTRGAVRWGGGLMNTSWEGNVQMSPCVLSHPDPMGLCDVARIVTCSRASYLQCTSSSALLFPLSHPSTLYHSLSTPFCPLCPLAHLALSPFLSLSSPHSLPFPTSPLSPRSSSFLPPSSLHPLFPPRPLANLPTA